MAGDADAYYEAARAVRVKAAIFSPQNAMRIYENKKAETPALRAISLDERQAWLDKD